MPFSSMSRSWFGRTRAANVVLGPTTAAVLRQTRKTFPSWNLNTADCELLSSSWSKRILANGCSRIVPDENDDFSGCNPTLNRRFRRAMVQRLESTPLNGSLNRQRHGMNRTVDRAR